MRIAREEIFGPVVCLIAFEDEAHAIAIANDSDLGLSGAVWTADTARGIEVARQIRTGTFSVNCQRFDVVVPSAVTRIPVWGANSALKVWRRTSKPRASSSPPDPAKSQKIQPHFDCRGGAESARVKCRCPWR